YKDRRHKSESYGLSAHYAAYLLELDITFPFGFTAEVLPDVRLRGSDSVHEGEYERVRASMTKIPRGYRLSVVNPLIMCRYFAIWWPPEAPSGASNQRHEKHGD